MEILTKVVEQSWPDRLREMKIGEEIRVDIKKASSVRHAISWRLKVFNPEMVFESKKARETVGGEELVFLKVIRTA